MQNQEISCEDKYQEGKQTHDLLCDTIMNCLVSSTLRSLLPDGHVLEMIDSDQATLISTDGGINAIPVVP